MAGNPKWITPRRQAYLVGLFNRNEGFCVYGHKPCKGQWLTSSKVVCSWGKVCNSPTNPDNSICKVPVLCNHRPEANKPILPCEVLHINFQTWHCSYANHACYKPFESHYTQAETRLIKEFVNEDRQARLAIQKVDDIANHRTNDRTYPLHGQFSGVSQDIYFDQQPEYFIESLGVSGLNFKPFARVRLASSPIRLYVNIADMLKPLSKHAKRKAIRHRHIPSKLYDRIDIACYQAVKHFKR